MRVIKSSSASIIEKRRQGCKSVNTAMAIKLKDPKLNIIFIDRTINMSSLLFRPALSLSRLVIIACLFELYSHNNSGPLMSL